MCPIKTHVEMNVDMTQVNFFDCCTQLLPGGQIDRGMGRDVTLSDESGFRAGSHLTFRFSSWPTISELIDSVNRRAFSGTNPCPEVYIDLNERIGLERTHQT